MRRMRLSKSCQSRGRFLRETDDADFKNPHLCYTFSVRESGGMADAPDLGSGAARHGGSSPPSRTTYFQDRPERAKPKLDSGALAISRAPRGMRPYCSGASSTRRFCARPSAVSLVATKLVLP